MEALTELEAIELMHGYKWNDDYTCYKCGCLRYKKGRKILSRKCSKCDYDESVLKFSAFEGLRVAPEVICGILWELAEKSYLDPEWKVVKRRVREEELKDEFGLIDWDVPGKGFTSLGEITDNYMKSENGDHDAYVRRIERAISRFQPTVKSLSVKFGLEENTVVLLMDRICQRFREQDNYGADSSIGVILNFLAGVVNVERKFEWLLGTTMVPMRGKWEYGVRQIGRQWYAIGENYHDSGCYHDEHVRWFIYKIQYTEDDRGNLSYEYLPENKVLYGTEEWQALFGAGNNGC